MNDLTAQLRAAMRSFPTGVTVVTTSVEGTPHGFTANAFTSVSLDPPSILICVNRRARSHALISHAGRFCVNILGHDQQTLAEHFAAGREDDQFTALAWEPTPNGLPRFAGALAWLDCELNEEHSVSTHTIFVGLVVGCGLAEGRPLGYFNGNFRDFGVHFEAEAAPRA